MTRKEILEAAHEAVNVDRQETYGPPENSFQLIADLWGQYMSRHKPGPMKSHEVAILLILMKVARLAKSPKHMNNWTDIAGYAACGAELASQFQDQPDLFEGGIGIPQKQEICKDANEPVQQAIPRTAYDPVTLAEATGARALARLLNRVTVANFSDYHKMVISVALDKPEQLNYSQFTDLCTISHILG